MIREKNLLLFSEYRKPDFGVRKGRAKKHMACCEKYKPYILKYKALISKYMPYIFDEKWYLIFNDLQEWKNMRFQAWILPLSGSFG